MSTGGCAGMIDTEWENRERIGFSDEPPTDHEIRATILGDVRNVWLPEAQLDKGSATGPSGPSKVFVLRTDPSDAQHPVRETAHFREAESAYWYHYEGGPLRRDVWLGPRAIRLRAPRKDE